MKKGRILAIVIVVILDIALFIAFGILCVMLLHTAPVFEHRTIELGEEVSASIDNYLTGSSWTLSRATLDISEVKEEVGRYEVYAKAFFKEYTFVIDIISPAFEEKTIELGDELSSEITEYLLASEELLEEAKLDISKIDTNTVGEYKANVSIDGYEYEYQIEVVDTTAPQLQLKGSIPCLLVDNEYDIKDFVESYSDISNAVTLSFEMTQASGEKLKFSEEGSYTIVIAAKDPSGNVTREQVEVIFDIPPMLIGAGDTYMVVGGELVVQQNVLAYDNQEGLITEKISMDTSALNSNVVGEYPITYEVTDQNGLTTEKTVTVFVCEQKDIANYKHLDDRNLSQDELEILCNSNYFSYEPLTVEDRDKAVELITPASVNIGGESCKGSGFIMDITPEYTYILSVKHVMRCMGKNTSFYFFDERFVTTDFTYTTAGTKSELALVRIKTSAIPTDILLTLKEAYIDENIYSELKSGQAVVKHCENWAWDMTEKSYAAKIVNILDSFLSYSNVCISMTGGARGGMSGCPIIDCYGRVIGSLTGHDANKTYAMRIENIELMRGKLNS